MKLWAVIVLAVQPAAAASFKTAGTAAAVSGLRGAASAASAGALGLPVSSAFNLALPAVAAPPIRPSAAVLPAQAAVHSAQIPSAALDKTAAVGADTALAHSPVQAAAPARIRAHEERPAAASARAEFTRKMQGLIQRVAQVKNAGNIAAHLNSLYRERPHEDGRSFDFAPGRRAPIRLPGYVLQSGEEPAKLQAVPGTPFVRVGQSLIDTRAPGAVEVLDSFKAMRSGAIVLGMFNDQEAGVVNAFAWGRDGIIEHKQAWNEWMDRRHVGGYTFMMKADGSVHWRESGGVYLPLPDIVKRAILRYMGVRPVKMSVWDWLSRWALRLGDRLRLALALGAVSPG